METLYKEYGIRIVGRGYVRSLVRKRDDYTCQDCGFRRTFETVRLSNSTIIGLKGRLKNLDVHHIDGNCGKKSKGYDSVKDLAKMTTLCHKCHYNRPEHQCKSVEFSESHSKSYA